MVEQSTCPNCGSEMDLSNLFISGKAMCPKCGFKGNPIKASDYTAKQKKPEAMAKVERVVAASDPLDLRNLIGKMAIVMIGLFIISILMPNMRALAPASLLGVVAFAIAYRMMEKR